MEGSMPLLHNHHHLHRYDGIEGSLSFLHHHQVVANHHAGHLTIIAQTTGHPAQPTGQLTIFSQPTTAHITFTSSQPPAHPPPGHHLAFTSAQPAPPPATGHLTISTAAQPGGMPPLAGPHPMAAGGTVPGAPLGPVHPPPGGAHLLLTSPLGGGEERPGRRRSRSRSSHRSNSKSPMSDRKRHQGHRSDPQPSKCVGIFGMSIHTTQDQVEALFKRYGHLEKVDLVLDSYTGKSRGFAFVYFSEMEEAAQARKELNGSQLDGRKVRVDYSITRRAHSPTPGIYLGRPYSGKRGRMYRRRGRLRHVGGDRGRPDRLQPPPPAVHDMGPQNLHLHRHHRLASDGSSSRPLRHPVDGEGGGEAARPDLTALAVSLGGRQPIAESAVQRLDHHGPGRSRLQSSSSPNVARSQRSRSKSYSPPPLNRER